MRSNLLTTLATHPETSQSAPRYQGNNLCLPTLEPQIKTRLQKGAEHRASGFHKKLPYPTCDWANYPIQSTRGFRMN